jgi:hypothetical protein
VASGGRGVRPLPVTCRGCGHHFPDNEAAWDHECPEWEREREARRPTLLSHRQIAHAVDRHPVGCWQRRLIAWGLRRIAPDATLYDALKRMSPREAERWARWLGRTGPRPTK